MELLNLELHDPEEYEGKTIYINDTPYIIGGFLGSGKDKITHYLINKRSNISTHVISILRESDNLDLIQRKIDLAEHVYVSNPGSNIEHFQFDFICTDEMKNPNGIYKGVFFVAELIGSHKNNVDERLNLAQDFINKGDYKTALLHIDDYLLNVNPLNTIALEAKAVCLFNTSNTYQDIVKVEETILKMIEIEPYCVHHYLTSLNICMLSRNWKLYVSLFYKFIAFSYEPYNKSEIMENAITGFIFLGLLEEAEKYIKYCSSKKHTVEEINDLFKLQNSAQRTIEQIDNVVKSSKKSNGKEVLDQIFDIQKVAHNIFPYSFSSIFVFLCEAVYRKTKLESANLIWDLCNSAITEMETLYLQLHLMLYYIENEEYHGLVHDSIISYLNALNKYAELLTHIPSVTVCFYEGYIIELAYEDLYNIFKIHRSYFEQETETLELIDFLLEVYQKNVKGV